MFKNNDDMLKAFYMYMDERPDLPLFKSNNERVQEPPSIIRWSRWLQKESPSDSGWSDMSYNKLRSAMANIEYVEATDEIFAYIEAEVMNNALVNNYNSAFAKSYMIHKYDWEKDRGAGADNGVSVIGLDAVKEMLKKEKIEELFGND